ncbi:PdxH Pyridoxamine-phosphate oxidase [Candidatus Nanopelagicaceae bacterium]
MDKTAAQNAEASSASRNGISSDAIRAMRRSYGEVGLEALPEDPFAAFHAWLIEASENPVIVEANAMVLSTLGVEVAGSSAADAISTRTVLLKDVSQGGFTFFTNYGSRKAQEIELHSQVTLLFPWYAMERQVAISGFAEKIDRAESEDYFATRPWNSQIGAWASAQSSQLSSREELEQRYAGAAAKWPEGTTVPCPPHWGGYRVLPVSIEFWQGRYSRLHDRIRFERSHINSDWVVSRYYP